MDEKRLKEIIDKVSDYILDWYNSTGDNTITISSEILKNKLGLTDEEVFEIGYIIGPSINKMLYKSTH